ncbi:probable leucine-rich repeat receptor-like protein kinase At1g35710 [Lates japonicus]|uniref:Probable leucine-rich repeat receptor-like protein kinase At1g35710 n=1 Tax=Lates japonicus TaxID=270547 RepID=A0AAD3NHJ2_LATJO|nr:probable leucine-rich repeat receptor-like protein kinase At1g35710 [Lates japonicus]
MTRVLPRSPQDPSGPGIRRMNPWDCSCGAEDFAASPKELQSRSLLDRQMEVTCESPPFLRGRLVWNVSVCTTSPTPGPPSVLQSGQSKPTDALVTVPASSETYVTSPSSETETHVPPHTGVTVAGPLCAALWGVFPGAVQHRRKRNNKTVTPGRPKEEKNKVEEDGRSNRNESAGHSENRDPELAGTRRPFTGVRANTDTVPYLSIGTSQSKTNPDDLKEQPTDSLGQRSQMGRVMGRISTWPPTAIQWQERCRMKEEEEEGNEAQKFPGEVKKTPKKVEHPSVSDQDRKEDEMEKNQMEDLPTAPIQDPLNMRPDQSSNLNDKTTSFSEAHAVADIKQEDPATARRQTITKTQSLNQGKLNQDLRPAENPARKSSSKAEPRHEPKRTVSSRQRADNRSTGSKAPSGGASPDDETLLHGNRYAFMDLLHEVVQNNGRWTRERWKQTHVNKQRR